MEERIYNCKVITPMFLGGADGKTAELRAPSIKGVLRYWWRAIHGDLPLNELQEKEIEIFGGSNNEEQKKSKVTIRIEQNNLIIEKKSLPTYTNGVIVKKNNVNMNILNYLCYGIADLKKGMLRKYIAPNSTFKLIFTYDNLSDTQKKEIEDALLLTSLVGGLGSRSRNGFGKFLIQNNRLNDVNRIIQLIKNINNTEYASYTAISKQTKVFKLKGDSCSTWHETLKKLGDIYHEVRTGLEAKHEFEKRQYISAPIIVNKKSKTLIERHAKPYFLSVIPNNNKYDGYIFCIPYNYPNNLHRNLNNHKYQEVINEFNGKLEEKMETIL